MANQGVVKKPNLSEFSIDKNERMCYYIIIVEFTAAQAAHVKEFFYETEICHQV